MSSYSRHLCLAFIAAIFMAGPGCGASDEKARQPSNSQPTISEDDKIAEIAAGVRPLVARCEELGVGKYQPDGPKVLVIDLKTGKRHPATDRLPEKFRGQSSDPDLLVFAVVGSKEDLLYQHYKDGTSGTKVSAKVAAVRWPKKEPLGFYSITADPPRVTFVRPGETPTGDLDGSISYGITEYGWENAPKIEPTKVEEGNPILGTWGVPTDNILKDGTLELWFRRDGTFRLTESDNLPSLKLPVKCEDLIGSDKNYRFKIIDPSTIELEFGAYLQEYLGKTAKITELTQKTCKVTFEIRSASSRAPTTRTIRLERFY